LGFYADGERGNRNHKEGICAEFAESAEDTEKKKQDGHGPSRLRINVPCPYEARKMREGAGIRSGRGRIRVGRF
jgi:hypothetical protein